MSYSVTVTRPLHAQGLRAAYDALTAAAGPGWFEGDLDDGTWSVADGWSLLTDWQRDTQHVVLTLTRDLPRDLPLDMP